MNPLQQDFDRLRCAGTPWCLVLTPDYRECQRSLCKMLLDQEDAPSLADIQRRIVEMATDRGLLYERGRETFDDIGGQASFKQFLQGLFAGPRRPRLVVRWDEIDKSVSSAASGTIADNTGVSQDMLKVLLT